jgi:hypothetical protein
MPSCTYPAGIKCTFPDGGREESEGEKLSSGPFHLFIVHIKKLFISSGNKDFNSPLKI